MEHEGLRRAVRLPAPVALRSMGIAARLLDVGMATSRARDFLVTGHTCQSTVNYRFRPLPHYHRLLFTISIRFYVSPNSHSHGVFGMAGVMQKYPICNIAIVHGQSGHMGIC